MVQPTRMQWYNAITRAMQAAATKTMTNFGMRELELSCAMVEEWLEMSAYQIVIVGLIIFM